MEGHGLSQAADDTDFLEVVVAFLIRRYGKHLVAVRHLLPVLFDYPERHIEKPHVHRNLRLGAAESKPPIAVCPLDYLVLGEPLCVDVGQPGVAAEDEYVPHLFKPLCLELVIIDPVYLLHCKIAPVHLVEMQLLLGKGVAAHPAVVPSHLIDAPESVKEFHCGVVVQVSFGTQVKVELVEEAAVEGGQSQVCRPVGFPDKVHDPVLADLVAEEGLLPVVLGEDEFFVVGNVGIEKVAYALALFVKAHHRRLNHVRRQHFAVIDLLVVAAADCVAPVLKVSIYPLLFCCFSEGAVSLRIPAVGLRTHLCGHVRHLAVDRDPCHDWCSALRIALALLHHEDDREGALLSLFLSLWFHLYIILVLSFSVSLPEGQGETSAQGKGTLI